MNPLNDSICECAHTPHTPRMVHANTCTSGGVWESGARSNDKSSTDTNKAQPRRVWTLHLQSIGDGPPDDVRVRQALKVLGRRFGLRCVNIDDGRRGKASIVVNQGDAHRGTSRLETGGFPDRNPTAADAITGWTVLEPPCGVSPKCTNRGENGRGNGVEPVQTYAPGAGREPESR